MPIHQTVRHLTVEKKIGKSYRGDAFQDGNFDVGGRFRVRDGFQGARTERHSRRVSGTATLHPQGAILERDAFQSGILE
jgi:hypothetical protein